MSRRKTYICPNCGTVKTTQLAYVRHLLEEAGPRGVTTSQFLAWGAGSRFGARIHELRHKHGLTISESNELYVLAGSETQAAPAASGLDPGAAGTLFNPAEGSRVLGAYDDLEAA